MALGRAGRSRSASGRSGSSEREGGETDAFDKSITDFSERYADPNERNRQEFVGAVNDGDLLARSVQETATGIMTGPTTTAPAPPDQPQARPWRSAIARTLLRAAATVVALIVIYYLLPLDHASEPAAIAMLIIGLVAFIALVTFHVRSILRSPFPQRRAIEALAINIPLFLLLFAATYVVLATISTSNFGQHLSHTDGLYFTVTVFSTVGFGDITAKTETARLVVTGQMIADLIILGLAIKVIFGAAKRSKQEQTTPNSTRAGTTGDEPGR